MKKICVYTCLTGNYDDLPEIENLEKGIDYYCFTNNKNLTSNTWKIIQIHDDKLDNHYLSRKIKMLGHPIISENYDISLWMDAHVVWRLSIKEFINKYFKKDSVFAAFKHSDRNSIHDEAIACLQYRKDTKEKITSTLNFLEANQFPDNLGLYEMTVFIKKHNDPIVIKTMELWFKTIRSFSKRDQLCFMYCIWKTGLKVTPIDLAVNNNPWFYLQSHIPNNTISDCRLYFGDSSQKFNFNKYIACPYQKTKTGYQISCTIPNDTNRIEINLANSVGMNYTYLKIHPTPHHIINTNTLTYHNKVVFTTGNNFIYIDGAFKNKHKFTLEINLKPANVPMLNLMIGQMYFKNLDLTNNIKILQSENDSLIQKNQKISTELEKIINSRGWQTLEKIRKIFYHTK